MSIDIMNIKKMVNDEVVVVEKHINVYNKIIQNIGNSLVVNSKEVCDNRKRREELEKEIEKLNEQIEDHDVIYSKANKELYFKISELKGKVNLLENELDDIKDEMMQLERDNDKGGDDKTLYENYKLILSTYQNQCKSLIDSIEEYEEDQDSISKDEIQNQISTLNQYYNEKIVTEFDDVPSEEDQISDEMFNDEYEHYKRPFKTRLIINNKTPTSI